MTWKVFLQRALGRRWLAVTLGPRLFTMGHGVAGRVRLLLAGVREGFSPGSHLARPVSARVAIEDQPFTVTLAERSDFLVLAALRSREFAVDLPRSPAVVVDGGAHIGLSSLFFRARYPDATIIALEPNPASFSRLETNVRAADVHCVGAALAAGRGTATLHLSDASWSASMNADVGGRAVDVPTLGLDDLVAERGIERIGLLKLDIEGAEFEALRSASCLDRIDAVVAELHFEHGGTEQEIREILADFEIELRYESEHRAILHAVRRPPLS